MDNIELYSVPNPPSNQLISCLLKDHSSFLQWEENEEVIDIGCGEGRATLECILPVLPKNCKTLTGVDVSPSAISVAEEKYSDPKITYSVFDIGAGELPKHFDGKFHHVFSFYCLHWVANQKQVFQNIYNMLKPGGQALISIVVTAPFYTTQEKLMQSEKWKPYLYNQKNLILPYLHSDDVIQKVNNLLQNYEFLIHDSLVNEKPCIFFTPRDFESFSCSLNRFIKYVPEHLQHEYIREYIDGIRKDKRTTSENFGHTEKIVVNLTEIVLLLSKPKI